MRAGSRLRVGTPDHRPSYWADPCRVPGQPRWQPGYDRISKVTTLLKVVGIVAFGGVTLWAAGFSFRAATAGTAGDADGLGGFVAGTALAILAYKGFTTITNSGDEVEDPHRNVGRAIIVSLLLCVVVYLLVAWAVGSNLTVDQIVEARDYSLAEAARPALGDAGVLFTVVIAVIATASGLLASLFAVSRMLAMLTDMELIPHRHFGMPGSIQQHTLVYTVVVAGTLAVLFDLARIASIGAIFYLVIDMAIQWGVFRHVREEVGARGSIVLLALVADGIAPVGMPQVGRALEQVCDGGGRHAPVAPCGQRVGRVVGGDRLCDGRGESFGVGVDPHLRQGEGPCRPRGGRQYPRGGLVNTGLEARRRGRGVLLGGPDGGWRLRAHDRAAGRQEETPGQSGGTGASDVLHVVSTSGSILRYSRTSVPSLPVRSAKISHPVRPQNALAPPVGVVTRRTSEATARWASARKVSTSSRPIPARHTCSAVAMCASLTCRQ